MKMRHNAGMTTNDLFLRTCTRYPEKIALIDGREKYSYAALNRESNQLANAMMSLKVGKGDKVAILSKNCKEFIFLYLAASKIGAVMVPLNYRCVARELEYMLNDCEAKVLIFEAEYSEVVEELRNRLHKLRHYVAIGKPEVPFAVTYNTFVSPSSANEPEVEVSEDDECAILHTSGTTGNPKGAVMTHRTRVACTVNILLDGSVDAQGVALQSIPLFHAGTLNISLLPHLTVGATVAVIPRSDPDLIARAVEEEKVTHIIVVPTILYNLLEAGSFEKFNFSSLRKIYYGGAPIPLRDLEILLAKLPKVEFFQGYGQTESTQLTVLKPQDHAKKFGCTGKPHVLVDLRVVDEYDKDVLPGEEGEVITRGPHILKEYLNLPEAHRQAFRNGWFRTGDVARIDEDGFITIVDRRSDMIISGGENIYPREIENVLYTHPKVKEVTVFGIPDERWGESVCAAIIVKENEILTEEEIVNYVRENLASYKKPRRVTFCKSFPRSPVGKILKEELKKDFQSSARGVKIE